MPAMRRKERREPGTVTVEAEDDESNLPEDCAVIAGSAGAVGAAAVLCAPADRQAIQENIEAAIRRQARRENDFMAQTSPKLFG
jgi:hypothetical protein